MRPHAADEVAQVAVLQAVQRPGATRHSGSGAAARYSSTATRAAPAPVNSTESTLTEQAVMPEPPAAATSRAVPVSRRAENGGPAGSDTRTVSWPPASHAAASDPVLGSSSGLPSRAVPGWSRRGPRLAGGR
ncbi:MAG TPA: hypothetical protein VHV09_12715 [Trebonia sp.]|nr:hypothetical protein [Trebonia sp.]